MSSSLEQFLRNLGERPVIPEFGCYPVLDRLGKRIVDPGGTENQPTLQALVDQYLDGGKLVVTGAGFNVFERAPLDEEDRSPGEDLPSFKAQFFVRLGYEPPHKIIITGVIGWKREHVIAYMGGGNGGAVRGILTKGSQGDVIQDGVD